MAGLMAEQILTLNSGSSSLKISLFDLPDLALADEREAEVEGSYADALGKLLDNVSTDDICAVGHRVVHGGAEHERSERVTEDLKCSIEHLAELAPLHNKAALEGIDAIEKLLPGVPQVAAFDTMFHSSMLPSEYLYGLPYEWYERWGIRRFGFHGLSHAYCAQRAAEMLGKLLEKLKIVTCHLGSGCSLAGVVSGRSVSTTMGFTPLEGLVMGTRSGSFDPGALLYLLSREALTVNEADRALNKESGLLGVSGVSSDMREILRARATGNERATLAFDVYVARLRESIGAMTAACGGVDALVFTAGVGEHSAEVRSAVAKALGWMGVAITEGRNSGAEPDIDISSPDAQVRTLVIHTREDLMVARETRQVLRPA